MPQVRTSTDRIPGRNNVNAPKQASIPAGGNNEDEDQRGNDAQDDATHETQQEFSHSSWFIGR